jgi:hypothetical protein
MGLMAIRQEKTGKNTHFITEDFKHYSLNEFLNQNELISLMNIQIIEPKSGNAYLRSKPNNNSSDNLDKIAITCNKGDYLLFDRKYLYLKALNGRVKKKWNAFSGKTNATIKDQDKSNFGPLPEGAYIVHFEKTLDYENNEGLWDSIKWVWNSPAWRFVATPLEQVKGDGFDRGNFYIHGGKWKGTDGCIEINKELNRKFHSFLKLYERAFKLVVRYPKNKST